MIEGVYPKNFMSPSIWETYWNITVCCQTSETPVRSKEHNESFACICKAHALSHVGELRLWYFANLALEDWENSKGHSFFNYFSFVFQSLRRWGAHIINAHWTKESSCGIPTQMEKNFYRRGQFVTLITSSQCCGAFSKVNNSLDCTISGSLG